MSGNERGSSSILFMVVVLPFLFILAVVGIEVTQFFGMREEVQRIVDSEAKQSLSRPYPSAYLKRRIASSTEHLKPYVEIRDVTANMSQGRGEVVVRGTFDGALNKFVGFLTQQNTDTLSFTISSTVRRAKTVALIVLDRSVGIGGARCGDKNLGIRAGFVSQVAQDLKAAGVDTVIVAAIPGVEDEIDILSANDRVPRCGGRDSGSYLGVGSLEGVEVDGASDSISIAYRATQLLLLTKGAGTLEQRAIVMVSPPIESRSVAIPATFSLLEHEAARQSVKITAVGLVVGAEREKNFFEMLSGSESGRARYLHVSEDEVAGGNPRIALVHHIQGHTFISR